MSIVPSSMATATTLMASSRDRSISAMTWSVPPLIRTDTAFGFLQPVTKVISSSWILLDLDQVGVSQVRGLELVDLGDDVGAGGLGQLLDVALLDAADGVDLFLGQVVLHQVVDALLAEDDVGARPS